MLSRNPLSPSRPSASTRRHQTRRPHVSVLSHPRRPRRHRCLPPPYRTHHHSRSRLTNLLTTCKHSDRKPLIAARPHRRGRAGVRPCPALLLPSTSLPHQLYPHSINNLNG